jgi:prolipoprotein diacylglyceryl transferase
VSLASIPSPTTSAWNLGPIPIRAYALCIVLGIVAACWVTERRMRARGAPPYVVLDIAIWAVPLGIVGARIYSLLTSPQEYFGAGHGFWEWAEIWRGGLGIWGAVAGGAVGALIGCRQVGVPLAFVADALAPGLPLAQAIGRWGNWFNNELYGRATTLPWGLQVHEMADGKAVTVDGSPMLKPGLYHPTFLYESLWDLGVAVLVYLLDRKYRFGRGRAFALYVMAYTVGRFWVEALRIDDANHFLGLRLNDWTSIVVFLGALLYFLRVRGPRLVLVPDGENSFRAVPEDEAAQAADQPATDAADQATTDQATTDKAITDQATTDKATTDATGSDVVETDVSTSGGTAPDDVGTDDVDAEPEASEHGGADPPQAPASAGPAGAAAEQQQ